MPWLDWKLKQSFYSLTKNDNTNNINNNNNNNNNSNNNSNNNINISNNISIAWQKSFSD